LRTLQSVLGRARPASGRSRVTAVAYAVDGKRLAAGTDDGTVTVRPVQGLAVTQSNAESARMPSIAYYHGRQRAGCR
jgi:hypothetical protein